MTDGRAALDMDRLPWLTEERKPAPRRNAGWAVVVPWALLAALLIAGMSYWLGMQSATSPEVDAAASQPRSQATATLPEPAAGSAQPVEPVPMPEVDPVVEPAPVRAPPARSVRKPAAEPAQQIVSTVSGANEADSQAPAKARPAVKAAPKLEYWPAIESTGASGRMVRIGTFGTRSQAKKGWWAIVRHYPGMRNLKAVVAPVPSLRNGRTYYRLQFGTTSQAHSTILCQRMRMIGQSCVVVGLGSAQAGGAQ